MNRRLKHYIMGGSQDGRNPYGAKGGYIVNRRPRMDKGMEYREDMRRSDYGDMRSNDRRNDYAQNQNSNMDMRGNYRSYDMGDMGRNYEYDGHYQQGSTYYPIQAMGTFEGYYGMPEQDYGYDMNRGRDYNYDMARNNRGRRDYGNYDNYNDYADYGETLSDEELEEWNKKLLKEFDEREKQMFSKDNIMQKTKMMNKSMENFNEKEFYTTVLMIYSDYKKSIGASPELAIKLAHDWLTDKDVKVKGGKKLAVYYDCIVEGEEDDD